MMKWLRRDPNDEPRSQRHSLPSLIRNLLCPVTHQDRGAPLNWSWVPDSKKLGLGRSGKGGEVTLEVGATWIMASRSMTPGNGLIAHNILVRW